jgi:heat-inducible transcriptional repressor
MQGLSHRAQTLLKLIIEQYIAEGRPIASKSLLEQCQLDVSSATIRNVMAELEHLGLLASPHTSSGRIPTPEGYRFFVNQLLTVQPLEPALISSFE